jgi:hypothetical protein
MSRSACAGADITAAADQPATSREDPVTSHYAYKPLDSSANEVRILRFIDRPEDEQGLIHCTLCHVSLDRLLPAYEEFKLEGMVRKLFRGQTLATSRDTHDFNLTVEIPRRKRRVVRFIPQFSRRKWQCACANTTPLRMGRFRNPIVLLGVRRLRQAHTGRWSSATSDHQL